MNYTNLFYWLTVADNARVMFIVGMILFTIPSVISIASLFFMGLDNDSLDSKSRILARKWLWRCVPFMFLFWSLFIFTPSKKDALLIVAGGQTMNFLTTDKSAKQIPHELSSFIVTELKNMASEARVDLNIKDQKQKLLDEAKNMTAKELMDKMKVDTTFAKIVLEK